MNRQAVLIASAEVEGEDSLPGVEVDLVSWRKFLTSNLGGTWLDKEIESFHKPDWKVLRGFLDGCKGKDYVFIVFSGHGGHVMEEPAGLRGTRVCLNDHDMPSVADFNPGNPRCAIVLDSCRGEIQLEEKTANMESFSDNPWRRLFDEAVAKAETGFVRMYACDIGQSSEVDNKIGSDFTNALIGAAAAWRGERQVYTLSDAFNDASKSFHYPEQQRPIYEAGRRLRHFPFAVKPSFNFI